METLQNLCLFNKSRDDMRLLLQCFESLVLKDELAVTKQSSIFNFFENKYFTHLYFYCDFKKYECSINLLFSLISISRSTSKRYLVLAW